MRVMKWFVWVVVIAVMSGGRSLALPVEVAAQGDDMCVALAGQALDEAGVFCGDLAAGEACIGHAGVQVRQAGAADLVAASTGDRLVWSQLDALVTAAAAPDEGVWGLAVLALAASSTGESPVTAVLSGGAELARPPAEAGDRPTLTIYNRGGAEINLRNGAGITYNVVGQLAGGEEALADGRNEQGDWLRIQYAGGIAWVFTPLIDWDGDQSAIDALEVLLPNDVTPVLPEDAAVEAFQLVTQPAPCQAAPSGLLLQGTGSDPSTLLINEVTLEFTGATLFVTAIPGEAMVVRVLDGDVTVTARGIPVEVLSGQAAQVSLGGAEGLTPQAPPEALRSFSFPEVAYAPFDLLPQAVACMVGVPTPDAIVTLRVGPGEQRGALSNMSPQATYAVLGWAPDPEGAPWWQLDTGDQPTWAAQAAVRAVGACGAVAEVEPPPLVLGPPVSVPAGDGEAPASGADFAPAANSVWQMHPGSDNLIGECSGAPAINFCDHLAAISPAGGGISWKGMEASPYFLTRIQPNVYSYSGPNVLGTGTVTMTLSFTSETTLNMTMSMVLNSEPNCQHVYYYSGSRNW